MESAINHMNEDHTDAILLYVHYYANMKEAKEAKIISLEGKEMKILVDNTQEIIIPLEEEISKENVRPLLTKMAKEARKHIDQEKLNKLTPKILKFVDSMQTAILSTISKENEPTASYSPILKDGNNFYLYISPIAEHFENIQHNKVLEMMFIEDESTSKMIIARKRARFKAEAEILPREYERFDELMDKFEEKIPKAMKIIREMTDFRLVKLTPLHGRYVQGFGQAYHLELDQEGGFIVTHLKGINEKGHEGMDK